MKNELNSHTIDQVVLLMASGMGPVALAAACVDRLGIARTDVADVVAEARRRLTLAADYHRDEQIGIAITRMNDLYTRALTAGDNKTALAAQRELNKLLALYREPGQGGGGSGPGPEATTDADRELAAIRGHLLPLALAADTYPLREHARIAADRIRGQQ